jgi:hypothetical protein
MAQKLMLLALAVVSAAALALPAGAPATEIHLTNVTKFSGTFNGGTLAAKEEPTIECGELSHAEGTVSAGGTTGTISLDYTGCRAIGFFFCQTAGAPLNNTIRTSGSFHFIKIRNSTLDTVPAVLITPEHTSITCAGFEKPNTITGNVIGTITSPECGGSSKKMSISFNSNSGPTQEHKTNTTGISYNLTSQTGTGGTIKEAGLTAVATVESTFPGTLDCT